MDVSTVLVVDDSPTDLHLLTGYLQHNGYRPLQASSGEEALRKASAEHPDLILMDVVMPGMNGFEATRSLAKNPDTRDIPVIVVTSKNQETDKIWAMRQGARDFVSKPVDEKTLIGMIRKL
jgi:twitching motility two-component system response regulator PilH